MSHPTDRRTFMGAVAAGLALGSVAEAQKGRRAVEFALPTELSSFNDLSVVLGRASDTSIVVSLLAKDAQEAVVEYGTTPGNLAHKIAPVRLAAGQPTEVALTGLQPNTNYAYRVAGKSGFDGRFHTRRAPGSAFTFCVQGDSHPERPQMSEPNLYARTLRHAAANQPDLYVCMGDDFSVEKIRAVNADAIAAPYRLQRPFLGLAAHLASLYLLNGNHEQGSLYNYQQTGELHELAVGVQTTRNRFFPMPGPGDGYTGNDKELDGIGPLRDYYAWTWGDALFVVLDNYWHSPALVDSGFHGGQNGKNRDEKRNRDWWAMTLGDTQYHWFRQTLAASQAKFKFVFAHHVMGSGRGGVEAADLYEWGGRGRGNAALFKQHRPNWELPVHQLMVKHGVSIFFQGHDHLYARQELDGVVYQTVPCPADPTYTAFNEDAYKSGTRLPNAGYLRVGVTPKEATVEYVRCYLPKDEAGGIKTGDVGHSYSVKARAT